MGHSRAARTGGTSMSILDEIKKLTHPYEDEDDDSAEFED